MMARIASATAPTRRRLSLTTHSRALDTTATYDLYAPMSAHYASAAAPRPLLAPQHRYSFSTSSSSTKFVGAHISASGGCLRALDNAERLLGSQARAFAFFVRPRLSWKPVAPIDTADAAQFRARLRDGSSRIEPSKVVVHGSYILNFGSHDAELRRKSVDLMVEEVAKCAQLGVPLYVFHPGSCTRVPEHLEWASLTKKTKKKSTVTDAQREEALALETQARAMSVAFIGECMAQVLAHTQDVALCVENMCGQGNVLGRDFQELRGILDSVAAHSSADGVKDRLGVCVDTCHAHASGMAMHSSDACEQMMASFDVTMGDAWVQRDVLKVLHVNDSMDVCGARKDRHENIGLGRIGLTAFEWIMNSPRFDHMPMILETPRRGIEAMRERLALVENAAHRELLRANMEEDTDANEIDLLVKLVRA